MKSQRGIADYGLLVILVLLLLSLLGNWWLFKSRDAALADKATAESSAAQWQGSAETCTSSVDKLAVAGKKQLQSIVDQLATDLPRIKGLQHDALIAARARPENPQDLCGSLEKFLRNEFNRERALK